MTVTCFPSHRGTVTLAPLHLFQLSPLPGPLDYHGITVSTSRRGRKVGHSRVTRTALLFHLAHESLGFIKHCVLATTFAWIQGEFSSTGPAISSIIYIFNHTPLTLLALQVHLPPFIFPNHSSCMHPWSIPDTLFSLYLPWANPL